MQVKRKERNKTDKSFWLINYTSIVIILETIPWFNLVSSSSIIHESKILPIQQFVDTSPLEIEKPVHKQWKPNIFLSYLSEQIKGNKIPVHLELSNPSEFSKPPNHQSLRARLVIVFQNCCLKRCENYGLKSVVEQCVFSVNKTKKCVWYHSLNNVFQCSKNINMCLVCMFCLIKKSWPVLNNHL